MAKSAKRKRETAQTKLCQVCNMDKAKYHCPADKVGYCSVACFKKHKAEGCTARNIAASRPQLASVISTRLAKARKLLEPADQAPLRSLASLLWPPDPLEDGLNALDDPLNRDEVKPLLHSELLAIAKSTELRRTLATDLHLKNVLQSVSRIPNAAPHYPQETRLRNLLGVGEKDGVPKQMSYRPGEDADKAKEASGRPAKAVSIAHVLPEETAALCAFNQTIKQILAGERARRSIPHT